MTFVKKKNEIREKLTKGSEILQKRKTLKNSSNPKLDEALYFWFLQKRSIHLPITDEVLIEKAIWFNQQLMGNSNFKASNGWLNRFKSRHGIRCLKVTGEKLSNDTSMIEPFKQRLIEKMNEMELSASQLYNADESALFWRKLLDTTLVHEAENTAPGRKISKDRVTFMPCVNADGTHKLRLLMLGKAINPRKCNMSQLPIYYRGSKKGWMTKQLFKEWFYEEFVPSVRRFSTENCIQPKAILLLDNAPAHLQEDELKSDDGSIITMYLPPNCTASIQPLDKNLIYSIKTKYRKALVKEILIESDREAVNNKLKSMNLKDVTFMINNAWENVSKTTIMNAWKSLIKFDNNVSNNVSNNISNNISNNVLNNVPNNDVIQSNSENSSLLNDDLNSLAEFVQRLQTINNPSTDVNIEEIASWATNAQEFAEFDLLNDQEIVKYILSSNDNDVEIINNEEKEDIVNNSIDVNNIQEMIPELSKLNKSKEALKNIDNLLEYAFENGYNLQDVLLLQNIRLKVLDDVINQSNNF